MPMSRNMKKLVDYALHNLDNVSVGVTVGLQSPEKGIGVEFTLQPKSLRWGFRLRHEKGTKRSLFYAVEQRPGLFHYGLRGYFSARGSYQTKMFPHPLKLTEICGQWPTDFWPDGLELLKRLATISKR